MAHPRKVIRQRAVATLEGAAGLPDTIYSSRVHRFQRDELPAVSVYAAQPPEEIRAVTADIRLERELPLIVEVYLEASADLDDLADDYCEIIEAAMFADFRMGGLVLSTILARTEIGISGEGDLQIGISRLTFSVRYRTEGDGTAII